MIYFSSSALNPVLHKTVYCFLGKAICLCISFVKILLADNFKCLSTIINEDQNSAAYTVLRKPQIWIFPIKLHKLLWLYWPVCILQALYSLHCISYLKWTQTSVWNDWVFFFTPTSQKLCSSLGQLFLDTSFKTKAHRYFC